MTENLFEQPFDTSLTGANTGIGKEVARDLSKRGAKVLLLCRNRTKAERVANEIQAETKQEVKALTLDLSSLQSVKDCAEKIMQTEDKLDYLINNAGNVTYFYKCEA